MLRLELTPLVTGDVSPFIRYSVSVRKEWPFPQDNTFSMPTQFYYDSLCALGQTNIARTFRGLCTVVSRKCQKYATEYRSDVARKCFKHIHEWVFPKIFDNNIAYRFIAHLHTLGARAPYTKEKIIQDIDAWVSEKPYFHHEFKEKCRARFLHHFAPKTSRSDMRFKDFVNDPLRWGTSGGASRSFVFGKQQRTKWSWALSKIIDESTGLVKDDVDLWSEAKRESTTCKVALKEEPHKTRPVITTPMASYLRQSYLMFRWGKPKINSPIGKGNWLKEFQNYNYSWYGCLDGERFDHLFAFEDVYYFVNMLGNLDSETRAVADEEMEMLKDLHIDWQGNKTWKWKGGLLSGWRITSLLGTFMSWCAFEYMVEETKMRGVINYGVMGDDIIYYSNTFALPRATMCKLYADFGLKANLKKTTSGATGEFLRKTYSRFGVVGYPVLALRSIFYANPWVSQYQLEKHQELSRTFLTYYSRVLQYRTNERIHMFTINHIINALIIRFGQNSNYLNWLLTPMSIGGGGPVEWSRPKSWTVVKNIGVEDKSGSKLEMLYAVFGITAEKSTFRKYRLESIKHYHILDLKSYKADDIDFTRLELPENMNITIPILRWFLDARIVATSITSTLNIILPRGMRNAGKYAILQQLLGVNDLRASLISVQVTPDIISGVLKNTRKYILAALTKHRNASIKEIDVSVFYHISKAFDNLSMAYGSW